MGGHRENHCSQGYPDLSPRAHPMWVTHRHLPFYPKFSSELAFPRCSLLTQHSLDVHGPWNLSLFLPLSPNLQCHFLIKRTPLTNTPTPTRATGSRSAWGAGRVTADRSGDSILHVPRGEKTRNTCEQNQYLLPPKSSFFFLKN